MSSDVDDLREKFALYDTDHDGAMSFVEFAELLERLGETLSKDEQMLAFDAIDRDGDGMIDFDEFAAWWTDA